MESNKQSKVSKVVLGSWLMAGAYCAVIWLLALKLVKLVNWRKYLVILSTVYGARSDLGSLVLLGFVLLFAGVCALMFLRGETK